MTRNLDLAPVAGVILAGGLARRMGGGDKALLPVAGRPILAHLMARLGPQVGALVLNANGDPARFAAFGLPVAPDGVAGFPGPLAGMLAGMDWAAAQGFAHVVTAAGDTPFPPSDLVARLVAARDAAGAPMAVATSGGRQHPTFALLPVALRDDLAAALAAGRRRVRDWTEGHGAALAAFPGEPFLNVNAPGDLARAEAAAGA